MAKKLLDQQIGKTGLYVGAETSDEGRIGFDVSYPVEKLIPVVTKALNAVTAKVPFLQRYVGPAIAGILAAIGYEAPAVGDAYPEPVAAHEAQPVEAAAPQA